MRTKSNLYKGLEFSDKPKALCLPQTGKSDFYGKGTPFICLLFFKKYKKGSTYEHY